MIAQAGKMLKEHSAFFVISKGFLKKGDQGDSHFLCRLQKDVFRELFVD